MNIQDCLKYSIHNYEDLFETPLGKAFENLNNQGIKAYMNCGWATKEAIEIITSDNYDGEWVVFTEQVYEHLIDSNECCLAYGGGAEDEVVDLKPLAQKIIKELEDQDIVEATQRGVSSRAYDRGRYSPTKEKGVHHFHKILTRL